MGFFKGANTFTKWQEGPRTRLEDLVRNADKPQQLLISALAGFGKTTLWSYLAYLLSKSPQYQKREHVLCLCPISPVRTAVTNTLRKLTADFDNFKEISKSDRGKVEINSDNRLTVVFTSVQKLLKEKGQGNKFCQKLVDRSWLLIVVEESDTTLGGELTNVVRDFVRKTGSWFVAVNCYTKSTQLITEGDLRVYAESLVSKRFSTAEYRLSELETLQLGCLQRRKVSYHRETCVLCPLPFAYLEDKYAPSSLTGTLQAFVSKHLSGGKAVLVWVVDPDFVEVVGKVLNAHKPLLLTDETRGCLRELEDEVGRDLSARKHKVVVALVDSYSVGVNGLQLPVVLFLQTPRTSDTVKDCVCRSVRQGAREPVNFFVAVPSTSLCHLPQGHPPQRRDKVAEFEEAASLVHEQVERCTGVGPKSFTKHLQKVGELCKRYPEQVVNSAEALVDVEVSAALLHDDDVRRKRSHSDMMNSTSSS